VYNSHTQTANDQTSLAGEKSPSNAASGDIHRIGNDQFLYV